MNQKRIVRSACRMCHGVCQVLVHLEGDRVVKITGDKESPTSRGYICMKGRASTELLYHKDRITTPLRRAGKKGENKWQPISWEEAFDEMTEKLDTLRRESGPEYLGTLHGTGRPYIGFLERFSNAYGTPNGTAPGHICYAPRIVASMLTMGRLPVCDVYGFGATTPECFVMWGCNLTHTGASDGMCAKPVLDAIRAAKTVIVVDPRRTRPAKKADHWLQIRPGTDGALAMAMINFIIAEDLVDHDFVDGYTIGYDKLVEHIQPYTPQWAEEITRIPAASIKAAARAYATASSAAIQWGNAMDMSACNLQTGRAMLILRALTGNLDKPGGDVLWVLPEGVRQKSIFGDIGFQGDGFLPQDKAELRLDKRKYPLCPVIHPPTFWKSIVSADPYRLKALWIMGANPLLTVTNPLQTQRALELLEYVVVSDFFLTPTAQYADLFLPSSTWLERDDVMNLHKLWCVIAQKKVAQIGEVKDDREVIIQLARRLGLTDAFPWKDYQSLLDWQLEETGLSFEEFCEMGILQGKMRYHKYKEEGFPTRSGKFEIHVDFLEQIGVSPLPVYREPPLTPVSAPEVAAEYPLILIAGAYIRYFFHSELRQIESLRKKNPDPLVDIHPEKAESLGIAEGDWVWIESPVDRVKMRARLCDGIAPDVICAQHAWWFPEDEPPDYGWKKSNINLLLGEMQYDPDTGSESIKSTLCKIYPVDGGIVS
ncbi:MAG: molybdopterin-dependent oxidoreductase [Proteobacteria bacterium]|nr:molybdopterin-dependent oxidoreductase [Pseudomonadota bacterium]